MIKFGFELEAFAVVSVPNSNNQLVVIPPEGLPTDGFPGLVEIRTTGGKSLSGAFGELHAQELRIGCSPWQTYKNTDIFLSYEFYDHKFTGSELNKLRRRFVEPKDPVEISNIYGKEVRNTNGKTLASFQINMSNELSPSYTTKDHGFVEARYGLLDIYQIVKSLDEEFEEEIKYTKRQPGMYCIKDSVRLEYRSLPNSVMNILGAESIYNKIKHVFKTLEIGISE